MAQPELARPRTTNYRCSGRYEFANSTIRGLEASLDKPRLHSRTECPVSGRGDILAARDKIRLRPWEQRRPRSKMAATQLALQNYHPPLMRLATAGSQKHQTRVEMEEFSFRRQYSRLAGLHWGQEAFTCLLQPNKTQMHRPLSLGPVAHATRSLGNWICPHGPTKLFRITLHRKKGSRPICCRFGNLYPNAEPAQSTEVYRLETLQTHTMVRRNDLL